MFASGDEGSDSLDEADSGEEEDMSHDPATVAAPTFNKKWGEDAKTLTTRQEKSKPFNARKLAKNNQTPPKKTQHTRITCLRKI